MKKSYFLVALLSLIFYKANGQSSALVNSFDGIPIYYETIGEESPALVFIHGWSCDRSYWKAQIDPFSKKYRVIAIDLAGHGESGTGRKNHSIESFGRDVVAVIDKLGLKKVILIGHSMGGDVIAEAAKKLKGRVVGLIMVDTYKNLGPGRTPESIKQIVDPLRVNFAEKVRLLVRGMFLPNSDTALVNYVVKDMSSAPPAIALSAMEAAFSYSREMTKTLQELKLPVIAINPDNAPTDTPSMEKFGVEVMIMPGVGHFLHMEDPERFNSILSKAIEKLNR